MSPMQIKKLESKITNLPEWAEKIIILNKEKEKKNSSLPKTNEESKTN